MGDARLARDSIRVATKTPGEARLARDSLRVLIVPTTSARLGRFATQVLIQKPAFPTARVARYTTQVLIAVGYSAAVLADSPVGYWKLDEAAGSTTVVDSSGGGHSGNCGGPLTFGGAGVVGKCCVFNGGVSEIFFGNGSVLGSFTTLTLECWFKATSVASVRALIQNDNEGGTFSTRNWGLYLNPDGTIGTIVFSGSSYSQCTTPLSYTDDTWHHVATVYDGSSGVKIYVDGYEVVQGGSLSGNPNSSSGSYLDIGYRQYNTTGASGLSIDEAAVYNSALTTARLQAHFTASGRTLVAPAASLGVLFGRQSDAAAGLTSITPVDLGVFLARQSGSTGAMVAPPSVELGGLLTVSSDSTGAVVTEVVTTVGAALPVSSGLSGALDVATPPGISVEGWGLGWD